MPRLYDNSLKARLQIESILHFKRQNALTLLHFRVFTVRGKVYVSTVSDQTTIPHFAVRRMVRPLRLSSKSMKGSASGKYEDSKTSVFHSLILGHFTVLKTKSV